jgi:hypothetical protein
MSVKANATDAAQAWVTGMGSATAKYTAGVNAVKTAPGTLAAAQAGVWAANVAAAQPKFARNVGAVSLQSWQASAVSKGAPRLASGAQAAQPKMQAFMTNFIPQLTNIVNGLPARGSFEANTTRLMNYINALHQAKGTF